MCRHRNHGFSAVRSVTTDCAGGSLRECAVIETMASAPYVALLPTAPAGSLRECAVIETMASAPYVALLQLRRRVVHVNVPSSKPWLQRRTALLSTAPASSLRECAVIETMASAPYVALLPTARRRVVYVNVPSSKPWLQRRT
ncbi:hypothetical protein EVAR_91183_1 [Eumeta japonica]|uniref:Uncharacterized protein n=1 Tax=Eumeta variegata TaxID=151549 RepID=A0A4C1ZLN4_EUMVA|nr:hypothetical protein EVAR_91183_1 [Eumeta japonica]